MHMFLPRQLLGPQIWILHQQRHQQFPIWNDCARSVATAGLACHCIMFIAICDSRAKVALAHIQLATTMVAGEVAVGVATRAHCHSMRGARRSIRSLAVVARAALQAALPVLHRSCHSRFILSGRAVRVVVADTVRVFCRCERLPLVVQALCQRLALAILAPPWCLTLPLLRRATTANW